jgi:type IV secretory pathway VirB10-like protein
MQGSDYSRLEKDFLGNERMVHYNPHGEVLGFSDVTREEDGTLRVGPIQVASEPNPDPTPPANQVKDEKPTVSTIKAVGIAAIVFVSVAIITGLVLGGSNSQERQESVAEVSERRRDLEPAPEASQEIPRQESAPSRPEPMPEPEPEVYPKENTLEPNPPLNRGQEPKEKTSAEPEIPLDLRGGDEPTPEGNDDLR